MTTPEDPVPKRRWTEADFATMGWHDARIHALALLPTTYELWLDIDYLTRWVPPAAEGHYTFWVAPATLVFHNAYDLSIDVETSGAIDIDAIVRDESRRPRNATSIGRDQEWRWRIVCQQGELRFMAAGYSQYLRSAPQHRARQVLGLAERGGISFRRGVSGMADE